MGINIQLRKVIKNLLVIHNCWTSARSEIVEPNDCLWEVCYNRLWSSITTATDYLPNNMFLLAEANCPPPTTCVAAPFVLSLGAGLFVLVQDFPLVVAATLLNIICLCILVCPRGCVRNVRTFSTELYAPLRLHCFRELPLVGVLGSVHRALRVCGAACNYT